MKENVAQAVHNTPWIEITAKTTPSEIFQAAKKKYKDSFVAKADSSVDSTERINLINNHAITLAKQAIRMQHNLPANAHVSETDVARFLGKSRVWVNRNIQIPENEIRWSRAPATERERATIAAAQELRRRGNTTLRFSQIARILKIRGQTLLHWVIGYRTQLIAELGIIIKPKNKMADYEQAILALKKEKIDEGVTTYDIADYLGIEPMTAYIFFQKNGKEMAREHGIQLVRFPIVSKEEN